MQRTDPINHIVWLEAASLKANSWNPNYVATPELKLLELSIMAQGWIQPILVTADGIVIDGFHRWRLSLESKTLLERYAGLVPCAVLSIPEDEAIALTVRINRAKGTHAAVRMSDLVKRLLDEFSWSRERVGKEIGANVDEVDLLHQDGVFKAKKIEGYRYSKAWIPKEGVPPAGETLMVEAE